MTNFSRFLLIVLGTMLTLPLVLTAQSVPLLSQMELDPYGLNRVWFHQLQIHPAEGKVQNVFLEGGQLFITTSDANLHVLNSETGQWLWSRSVGQKDLSLTEPAVNSRIVAVHNNLMVFLFNRKNGKQLLQIPLPEAASAPCEMSEHYLYVPLVNQTLMVFTLKESLAPSSPKETAVGDIRHITDDLNPELAKIVQQFEDAKQLLRTAKPIKPEDDSFVLDSTNRVPITCVAFGVLRTKPLLLSQYYAWKLDDAEQPTHEIDKITHKEFIAWVTEQGFLYTGGITLLSDTSMSMAYWVNSAGQTFYMNQQRVAQIDRPGNKALHVRPTQSQLYPVNESDPEKIRLPNIIITGGRAAYIFAIDAKSGEVRWQYPAQGQLLEPIAVIGREIYAPTSSGIFHALDFSGKDRWSAKNVKRFVAASQNRIYVLDQRDRLVGLDRATGVSLFVYDVRRFDHCYYNLETDQIILVTNGGLVQCLRERQFATDTDSDAKKDYSLRHRITCAEFVDAIKGGEMPNLWWLEEKDTSESSESEAFPE